MPEDISYTPEEVAAILKISRFTVYELIKRGDLNAYRIGRKVRVESADLEKYKQRSKGNLPETKIIEGSQSTAGSLIICGQDIVLDILTRHLEKRLPSMRVLRNHMGSIDGLLALYRGTANVATSHLWDGDTGEYNIPYIRRMMPGHKTVVINLVRRQEGFYVAKGNPKSIQTWSDVTKTDVTLINRERGSGARVLLDEQLRKLSIEHGQIKGYEHEETSHLAVASKVARGEADVGLGIEKAGLQVPGIDFIPLQIERYDLVIRKEDMDQHPFQCLLAVLRSPEYKTEVSGLGGYDVSRMGEVISEV